MSRHWDDPETIERRIYQAMAFRRVFGGAFGEWHRYVLGLDAPPVEVA